MRFQKLLFVLITVMLFLVTGCSGEIENEEQTIIVEKRIGDENMYGSFKEVTDNEQILSVKEILDNVYWENAKVNMSHPPDYKFHFQYINKDIESNPVQHSVWISPSKDKLELVIEEQSNYAQLTKEDSATLFKIITGEKLVDLK